VETRGYDDCCEGALRGGSLASKPADDIENVSSRVEPLFSCVQMVEMQRVIFNRPTFPAEFLQERAGSHQAGRCEWCGMRSSSPAPLTMNSSLVQIEVGYRCRSAHSEDEVLRLLVVARRTRVIQVTSATARDGADLPACRRRAAAKRN